MDLGIFNVFVYLYLLYLIYSLFSIIIDSKRSEDHSKKVEETNIRLMQNHPPDISNYKFNYWRQNIEPKYINWGLEGTGIYIPYYSTVKYPPDWNMRRLYVAEMYDYKCAICSKEDKLGHTHHLNPLSKGGNNSIQNLVYLCRYCHEEQHWHMKQKKEARRRLIKHKNISEEEYLEEKKRLYFEKYNNKKLEMSDTSLDTEKYINNQIPIDFDKKVEELSDKTLDDFLAGKMSVEELLNR